MLETLDSDERLVARVRAGDAAAFDVLTRRHHGWLVGTCQRHLGGDHHLAQDLAQECLIKLHSALTRDDRDLSVQAWLAVVARHACIDQLRRRTPVPVDELPEAPIEPEDPFDVDPALATAWAALSPRHRDVLTHRELVGLSYDEIALVMDTTVPAVETLLFRARASLRKHYSKAGGRLLGCGAFLLGLDRLGRGPHADTEVVAHLASCTACRRALDQMDAVGAVLRGAPVPQPGRGGMLTGVVHRVADHVSTALAPAAAFGGQVGTALTAAAVALSPTPVHLALAPVSHVTRVVHEERPVAASAPRQVVRPVVSAAVVQPTLTALPTPSPSSPRWAQGEWRPWSPRPRSHSEPSERPAWWWPLAPAFESPSPRPTPHPDSTHGWPFPRP